MGDNEWHEVTRNKSNSVFQRLRFPSSVSNRYPSKEDQTQKISKSVFVKNFWDHFLPEIFRMCVLLMVRVDNMERLIENLSTIWIGKYRLHANVVRFHRDPKSTDSQSKINVPHPNKSFMTPVKNMGTENRSFAYVLNVGNGISSKATKSTPAIVLDDDCLIKRDFSCSLMGKIKDLNAIPNLNVILYNEGFVNVKISHLGELEPWSPNFNDEKDDNSVSRDESADNDLENNNDNLMNDFELDNENEIDHVSESSCMNENDLVYKQASKSPKNPSKSGDQFNIYSLLKKNKEEVVMEDNMNNVTSDKSDPSFPPGFTPDVGKDIEKEVNSAKEVQPNDNGAAPHVSKRFGGNFAFDYVLSPSVGVSGGILYAWDPSLFHKDNATVLDLFVALRGTWIPSATKILIIVVYAPHDLNEKRMLWEFLGHLIDTWDGKCVLWETLMKCSRLMKDMALCLIRMGLHLSMTPFLLQALCLDRHLSDHRPILMRELNNRLSDLDKLIDLGSGNKELVSERAKPLQELFDLNSKTSLDLFQKAKIRCAIEEGEWIVDPSIQLKGLLSANSPTTNLPLAMTTNLPPATSTTTNLPPAISTTSHLLLATSTTSHLPSATSSTSNLLLSTSTARACNINEANLFVVSVVGEENLLVKAEIEELDDVTMNEDVEVNVILEPGCMARIKVDLDHVSGKFKITKFVAKHNHQLLPKKYKHLTKKQRKMHQAEKMFVVRASIMRLGATKAHNLYSKMKGRTQYVHGTSDDFKNHIRDVNAFVGESDAQRINKMENRKKFVPNFMFYYLVENDELVAMFWADGVVKCNYKEFGDIISFDATF
nr:hypothetical protein [Tanacetum cinerariifolium]